LPGHRARLPTAGNRSLAVLVALAVAVRIAAFWQASSTPLLTSWRWDQSDMGFFHEMAERVADGDLLLNGTFHPVQHHWRREIARQYLQRHPDTAGHAVLPEDAAPSADAVLSTDAERRLWDRWLGEKTYYQEPLYTYLLAAGLKLPGRDARWTIALQMVAGVLTVVLLAAVARRCFGETAAIVAAALAQERL